MKRRHYKSCYPLLDVNDPRWTAAVIGVWGLVATLGLLAAVGAGTVAAWCWRRIAEGK